jgi:hypothetical protein
MAVKDRRLTVDDLSAQPEVFYAGTCPGGAVPTLWEFSHKSESKKDGVRYWFSDAYQPASRMPLLVPFKRGEVGRYLRRV